MSMFQDLNRRRFLQGLAAGGATTFALSRSWATQAKSPNDRPALATIGLRNQGMAITPQPLAVADLVALADVDANVLGNCGKTHRAKEQ